MARRLTLCVEPIVTYIDAGGENTWRLYTCGTVVLLYHCDRCTDPDGEYAPTAVPEDRNQAQDRVFEASSTATEVQAIYDYGYEVDGAAMAPTL